MDLLQLQTHLVQLVDQSTDAFQTLEQRWLSEMQKYHSQDADQQPEKAHGYIVG